MAEDRRFYLHPGIDPFAVFRALRQNLVRGKVVSGASTLSMQLMRIRRGAGERTYSRKIIEMFMAVKLEIIHSKEEILNAYSSEAPFGGNVVGLNAAAWRYYACDPAYLSWGESAALAVLPNAPSLIFPGRNENDYKRKRDALLSSLMEAGEIDSLTFELAVSEPLPVAPKTLPRLAPHLLERLKDKDKGKMILSSLSYELQKAVNAAVQQHSSFLRTDHIYNLAAIVVEVNSGKVLAYAGNADWSDPNGGAVDMIMAERSSGSILKPFLYTAMLDAGMIGPDMLLPDLPVHFSGYSPQNFDLRFRGAVPASSALSHSLNLPAVWMLREYSPLRFLELLHKLEFTSFRKNADHYGLSLILGGGEVRLDELVNAYAAMGRTLLDGYEKEGFELSFLEKETRDLPGAADFNPASVYTCLEALKKVNRPQGEQGWQHLSSSNEIAWKTGTSFGFRDAWAVGLNRKYVVGVWAGNADGEGRPGLTGQTAAAPLLFEIFGLLDEAKWFDMPLEHLAEAEMCTKSGYRAGPDCAEKDTLLIPVSCLVIPPCPYHHKLVLNEELDHRVSMDCYPPDKVRQKEWFILPPSMANYFRIFDASYQDPPPYLPGCTTGNEKVMEFIYPGADLMVYLPRDMTGEKGEVILEAAHHYPEKKIYWDLDGTPLGVTQYYHNLACQPNEGAHILTLTDEDGYMIRRKFEVVN